MALARSLTATLVIVAVVAPLALAASSKVIARETASGDYAIAIAAGSATRPHVVEVKITASPNQRVSGAYTIVCSKGFGAGSKSGQFAGRTPMVRKMRFPMRNPDDCTASASGQLDGSGRIVVTLIAR
jgi:hypothetical protein